MRVLGEKKALEWMGEVFSCVESQRQEISQDRPELSYAPEGTDLTSPAAIVTVVRARPGQQDACEELIRKIAEAMPKVNDRSRIITYETAIGELGRYWTVRPMESFAELDQQLPPAVLLNEAFGAAEGGLIFRSGLQTIEQVERNIVSLLPDLSNAG